MKMGIAPLETGDIGQFLGFIRRVAIPYRMFKPLFLPLEVFGRMLPSLCSEKVLELLAAFFDFRVLVAKNGAEIVGVMITSGRERVWIVFVGVNMRFRRLGVATALFEEVFAQACRRKVPVGLKVRRRNTPALNLYKKLGFRIVAGGPVHYKMVRFPV